MELLLLLVVCIISLTCDCASLRRQQDVRETEIDKVEIHQSFRPGDIVRAVVVSSFLSRYDLHILYKAVSW